MVFLASLASVLVIGGVSWLIFAGRVILWFASWFARKMHKEASLTSYLSSPVRRIVLWRLRTSGILWIVMGLFLFVETLIPEVARHIPNYVFIIAIALPIVAGYVLLRVGLALARKQTSSGKVGGR